MLALLIVVGLLRSIWRSARDCYANTLIAWAIVIAVILAILFSCLLGN